MLRCCIAACLAAAVAVTFAQPSAMRVTGAWARATPPGAVTGAAYLRIDNDGADDRLLGASSPAAREIELHTHVEREGMKQMTPLDSLPLRGGASLVLEPGHDHLMLIGLVRPLLPGDALEVTLTFERAGPIEVDVPVVDARGAVSAPRASAAPVPESEP